MHKRAYLRLLVSLPAFAALAGCATHTWAPGPDARGTFSEADGRCKLLANNTGGGFYAQGKPAFVAGAAMGAAIGQAIKAQNNYNACMEASGWEIADGPRPAPVNYTRPILTPAPAPASPPVPQTSAAAQAAPVTAEEEAAAEAAIAVRMSNDGQHVNSRPPVP